MIGLAATVLREHDAIAAIAARLANPDGNPTRIVEAKPAAFACVPVVNASVETSLFEDDERVLVVDARFGVERASRVRVEPDAPAPGRAWGERLAAALRQEFAFVLWDKRHELLVLGRDPLGVNPLYYVSDADGIRCASEMHALFGDARLEKAMDFEQLALALSQDYAANDRTLYENVRAVPPAHFVVWSKGETRAFEHHRFDPDHRVSFRDERDYAACFRQLLDQAVRRRLTRTSAAQVSGGLDSCSVAALVVRAARDAGHEPPLLVNHAYPGLACDEGPHAEALARHVGLPLLRLPPPGGISAMFDLQELPPDVLHHPVNYVYADGYRRLRSQGLRSVWGGTYADQLISPIGYETVDALRAGRLAAATRGALANARSPARFIQNLPLAAFPRVRHRIRALRGTHRGPRWLARRAADMVAAHREARAAARLARRGPTQSWIELTEALRGESGYTDVLSDVNQLARLRGVQMLLPFVDLDVASFLLSIPPDVRASLGRPRKALLVRSLGSELPALVRERPSSPAVDSFVDSILLKDRARIVDTLLLEARLVDAGLVAPGALRQKIEAVLRDCCSSREVGIFASLEMWARKVIG